MRHFARPGSAALLAALWLVAPQPSPAADITQEWANVKPPPVPQLKPVTIDSKTTGLLVLDLMKGNCGVRPRCPATVPAVRKLIETARAHGMTVFYSLTGGGKPADMIDQSLVPGPHDVIVQRATGADKFIDSSLDQDLKQRGVKTVIVTGTSAQGAVAGTANGAAQRGYKAIVPVDGMSSEDAYREQYAAYHIAQGGPARLIDNAILTRSDLIKFGE